MYSAIADMLAIGMVKYKFKFDSGKLPWADKPLKWAEQDGRISGRFKVSTVHVDANV